jgi:hypothetical protein
VVVKKIAPTTVMTTTVMNNAVHQCLGKHSNRRQMKKIPLAKRSRKIQNPIETPLRKKLVDEFFNTVK